MNGTTSSGTPIPHSCVCEVCQRVMPEVGKAVIAGQEPAFPFACQGPTTAPEFYYGITIRDYFAAKAMASILTDWSIVKPDCAEQYVKDGCAMAYIVADAMLAAREAKP